VEVTVRFFAGCREAVKQDEATVAVSDGATLSDLQGALAAQFPAIAHYVERVRYSVNWEYVTPDVELSDGDEVAMIPPVAGGSDRSRAWVTEDAVSEEDVRPLVETSASGAVVIFLGVVRNHAEGKAVEALTYEAYPPMADKKMLEIAEEAHAKWPLHRVAVAHRIGHLGIGDASIAIGVSSSHRREAFAACEFVMDRIKEDVPIWKKEHWAGGPAHWVGDEE
jgi:MoaE-MoaD fusion protein